MKKCNAHVSKHVAHASKKLDTLDRTLSRVEAFLDADLTDFNPLENAKGMIAKAQDAVDLAAMKVRDAERNPRNATLHKDAGRKVMHIVSKIKMIHRRLDHAQQSKPKSCWQQCCQSLKCCASKQEEEKARPMVQMRTEAEGMMKALKPQNLRKLLQDASEDLRQEQMQVTQLQEVQGGCLDAARSVMEKAEEVFLSQEMLMYSDNMMKMKIARDNIRHSVAIARELHDVTHDVVDQTSQLSEQLSSCVENFETKVLGSVQRFKGHLSTGSEAGFASHELGQHKQHLKDSLKKPLEEIEALLDAQIIGAMAGICIEFCSDLFADIGVV